MHESVTHINVWVMLHVWRSGPREEGGSPPPLGPLVILKREVFSTVRIAKLCQPAPLNFAYLGRCIFDKNLGSFYVEHTVPWWWAYTVCQSGRCGSNYWNLRLSSLIAKNILLVRVFERERLFLLHHRADLWCRIAFWKTPHGMRSRNRTFRII